MGTKPGVLVVVTMDTKGQEALFLCRCIEEFGGRPVLMDPGIMGESPVPARVGRYEVAEAGGLPLDEVRNMGHEGRALAVMTAGATALARELFEAGEYEGVIGLGGSMGTTLGSSVMRALPLGAPKVMISTMASRNTRDFVGTRDIMMFHSVSDLAGLNRLTRQIIRNGAAAITAMTAHHGAVEQSGQPLVALSTLGTTETTATRLREILAERGREVVTFHTVGAGGQAMDELIAESGDDLEAVLDMSLHELADHHFGGDYDAGPERGLTAARRGVPLVLCPCNMDFLVTGTKSVAAQKFPGRPFHLHNSAITVVRTTREELEVLGRLTAGLANVAAGPVAVVVPLHGLSAFDHPQGPLYDPEGPGIVLGALKKALKAHVHLEQVDRHANDPEFASDLIRALEHIKGGSL